MKKLRICIICHEKKYRLSNKHSRQQQHIRLVAKAIELYSSKFTIDNNRQQQQVYTRLRAPWNKCLQLSWNVVLYVKLMAAESSTRYNLLMVTAADSWQRQHSTTYYQWYYYYYHYYYYYYYLMPLILLPLILLYCATTVNTTVTATINTTINTTINIDTTTTNCINLLSYSN